MNDFEKTHSAASGDVAFSYQFFVFVYQLLKLQKGERVGYEMRDDVHIETADNKLILIQVKHTIQKNAGGDAVNLTNLDGDLWKTLANWVDWIKASQKNVKDLANVSYVLFTNKGFGEIQFCNGLKEFINNKITIDDFISQLNDIYTTCGDQEIMGYIEKVKSYDKKKLKIVLNNISVKTENDDIIQNIKNEIEKSCRFNPLSLERVYKSLTSTIYDDKFKTIKNGSSFVISFDEFNQKYRNCFEEAYERERLPIRDINIDPPLNFDSLRGATYIQQLDEIYAIKDEEDLIETYMCKLTWENHLQEWRGGALLPEEYKIMEKNACQHWRNSFNEVYSSIYIKQRNNPSIIIEDSEILPSALLCLSKVRNKDINYREQNLNTILSNGFFYYLSDIPIIGWHLNWKKYKEKEVEQ